MRLLFTAIPMAKKYVVATGTFIVRNLGETTLSLQMTSKMMHLLKIQSHF